MRRLGALVLTAMLGAGCSAGFDPSSYLKPNQLRVLGVVAEPPEVAAGATSQLTVLSPPLDDGTTTTYQWAICTKPPPPGTADVADDCLKEDTASFLIPVDGSGPSVPITMPADIDPSMLGVPDVSGGLYLPVRVRAFAGTQRVDNRLRPQAVAARAPAQPQPGRRSRRARGRAARRVADGRDRAVGPTRRTRRRSPPARSRCCASC